MKLYKLIGYLLLLITSVFSCTTKQHPPVSFYYWKQSFELSKPQMKLLQSCGTQRLYVKFFDVVLDENLQIKPISKIDFQTSGEMVLNATRMRSIFFATSNRKFMLI